MDEEVLGQSSNTKGPKMASTKWGLVSQSNHRSCDVTQNNEGMTVTNTNVTSYHYIKQKMWPVLGQRSSFIAGYSPASIHPRVKEMKLMSLLDSRSSACLDTRLTCCPAAHQQINPLSSLVQAFTAGASTSIAGQQMPSMERTCVHMPDKDSPALQTSQTDWTNNMETAISASEETDYMNNIIKQCTLFSRNGKGTVGRGSQFQEETELPVPPPRLQRPRNRTLSPYKTDASSQTQNGHNHNMTTAFRTSECNRHKTSSSPNLLADQDIKPARPQVIQSRSSCVTSFDSPTHWLGQVTWKSESASFKGRHPYAQLSSDSLGNEHHYLELSQEGCMLESGKSLSPGRDHGSLESLGFDSRPRGSLTSEDISASKDSMIISPENQRGVGTMQEAVPPSSDDDHVLLLKASAIEDLDSMPVLRRECEPLIPGNQGEFKSSRDPSQVVWGEKAIGKQLVPSKKRRRKSFTGESNTPEQTIDQLNKTPSKKRTGVKRGLTGHTQSVAGFSGRDHELVDQMDKAWKLWGQKCRRRCFLQEKQIVSSLESEKSAPTLDHFQFWKTQKQTAPCEQEHVILNATVNAGRVGKAALKGPTDENKAKKPKHMKSCLENIMGEKSEEFSGSGHGTEKRDSSLKPGKRGRRPNKDNGFLSMDIKNAPCVTHEDFTYGKCSHLDLFQSISKRPKRCYILKSPAITMKQFGLVRSNPTSKDSHRTVISRRTSLSSLPLSVPPKLTSLSQTKIPNIACDRNHINLTNDKLVCAKPQRVSTSHTIILDKRSIALQANCSSGSPLRQRGKTSLAISRHKTSSLSPCKPTVMSRSSLRPSSFSVRPQKPTTNLSVCTFRPSAISNAAISVDISDKSTQPTAKIISSGRIHDVVVKNIKRKRRILESSSGADQHDIRTVTSCLKQAAWTHIDPEECSVITHGPDRTLNSNIRHVYFDLPHALKRRWKFSDKTAVENPNPSKTKDSGKRRVPSHSKATFRVEGRGKKKKASYCSLGVQTDDVCSSVPSSSTQPITTTTASANVTISDTNSQTGAGDCLKSEHAQIFNAIQLTGDLNLKIQPKPKEDGGHILRGFFYSSQASDLCNSANHYNESGRERAKVRSRSEDRSITSSIDTVSDERIPSSEPSLNQSLTSLSMVTLGNGLCGITKFFTFI